MNDKDAIIDNQMGFLHQVQGALTVSLQLTNGGGAGWMVPEAAAPPPAPVPDRASEPTCPDESILTLREISRSLTTTPMLAAMEQAGRLWNESYVKKHLAEMVRRGIRSSPRMRCFPAATACPSGRRPTNRR